MNRRVISNSMWMMSEKLVSIFGLIFVVSYVAKYVGPGVFGQIALATSLFQITQVIAQLGSDVIIFKRISKSHTSGVKLINSTLPIRAIIYIVVSIPVVFFAHKAGDVNGLVFVVACFISCFFSSIDVFSLYFDARLESMKNTVANVVGLLVSLAFRWLIVAFNADEALLAVPIVLTGLVPLLIRAAIFRNNFNLKAKNVSQGRKYKKYLIKTGSVFVISSLSAAIYTRLSMIILGYIGGDYSVGIFSVAVTLAGSWAFILNAFITSTLPSIFSEKNDAKAISKTARLNVLIFVMSLIVILGVGIVGERFIFYLYGDQYIQSYPALVILSFSTMISSLGTISSRFIARYSGYAFLSKKMLSVAVVSFCINIPLIHYYGINGAAAATLVTELISLTLFNYMFRGGVVFTMHRATLSFKTILGK